jgi:hypothetical protein
MLPISGSRVQSGSYRCSMAKGEEKANRVLRVWSSARESAITGMGDVSIAAESARTLTETNHADSLRESSMVSYASDVTLTL